MEPIVLFGAGVVLYCGYISLNDFLDDIRGRKATPSQASLPVHTVINPRQKVPSSTAGQGDGVAARWPAPLAGSF